MIHPSYRELDLVALGEELPGVRQHLASCAICSAHLESLARPLALPVWENASRRKLWLPRWLPALGAAAAAILAAAVFLPSGPFSGAGSLLAPQPSIEGTGVRIAGKTGDTGFPAPAGAWVAAKGSPSVGIYVKRGNRLGLWDGKSPVLPGDRLRVRVSARGFTHVAVASRTPDGKLVPLFDGAVGEAEEFLVPGSWEVDDQGGQEELVIGLDNERVDLETATWRTELTLPKAAPR